MILFLIMHFRGYIYATIVKYLGINLLHGFRQIQTNPDIKPILTSELLLYLYYNLVKKNPFNPINCLPFYGLLQMCMCQ